MADKQVKERKEIPDKYKWNIQAMFPDESVIDSVLEEVSKDAEAFTSFRGHLTESGKTLLSALKSRDELWMKLEKVYVYARMRRDEDNRKTKYQAMTDKCMSIIASVSAATSFFTPEILSAEEDKILGFIDDNEELETYRFLITDMLREKKHILSEAEENILAQMSEVTGATNDIFTMLNDADMKFGEITDEDGDKVELTHGNYIVYMESHDRNVRKDAYEHLYSAFKDHINTLAATYNYNTKTDVVSARIRKYESARAASLAGGNIPLSVYDSLVDSVNETLPSLHKYMGTRKRLLGLDKLKMHDIYVPLIQCDDDYLDFEDALDIMRNALSPLGDEYVKRMNKGIIDGWIDVFENVGKTSGAYSFGSYDSMPYILMNYTGKLEDVFTIVHEMGHSMNSSYTRENQPYIYGSHSIFTAEVASTVNENLLMQYLLKNETDEKRKLFLLNKHIEGFRTTLFRQTMFAEFEQLTHEAVENGQPLTAEWMSDEYGKLNEKYFGPDVETDDFIKIEWARIPHFYNAFYVYQYATGYSAATAISNRILTQGEKARDEYLDFLKCGENDYPIELLKIAGVDMSTKEPVSRAMETFQKLVDEFDELV